MDQDIRYWKQGEHLQNFGDFLSQYFQKHLFFAQPARGQVLHVIGSCIDDFFVPMPDGETEPPVFWGCGLRTQTGLSEDRFALAEILAVRGPLTRSALRLGDSVPMGDPGLLLPALYTPALRDRPASRALLVPHFHDKRADIELLGISGCDDVLRPNLANDTGAIDDFIDRLVAARFVLCGSLHAAIAAAAYGVKFAFWDSGDIDLPFKWRDFSASIDVPCAFHETIGAAEAYYEAEMARCLHLPVLWPLLVAAPLPVRPDAFVRVVESDVRRHGMAAFDIKVSTKAARRLQDTWMAHALAVARAEEQASAQIGDLRSKLGGAVQECNRLAAAVAQAADAAAATAACEQAALERQAALEEGLAEARDSALAAAQAHAHAITQMAAAHAAAMAQAEQELAQREKEQAQRAQEREQQQEAIQRSVLARQAELEAAIGLQQEAALAAEQAHARAIAQMAARHGAILTRAEQDRKLREHDQMLRDQARAQRERDDSERIGALTAERDRARQSYEHAAREAASAEFRLAAVEGSTVWKATWPLRRAAGRFPVASRLARRAAQLFWWTITGQLPQRLRWRHARRAAMAAPPASPPAQMVEYAAALDIVLPHHPHPVVSVIVPSYGQVDFSARCLAAIAAHPPGTPFEVILAEDASGDPAIAQLRQVANLRLIENRQNLGFLLNCNEAAGHSNAEFLLFLNNDTQVQPGWLDALVDLLRRRSDAAAAGAKLIYPDGRLQEAGGIIWDDATGWNYGRLDDPDKPVYNYVRETDYLSGAALLVRRADFEALGGFDPAYAPAYCEDSDLAFRLRAAGRRVLYQPRSVVVHFEGVTHGTDLGAGMKAYQVTNQARLRQRWGKVLAAEHYPSATHVMRARDHARGRRVVLVIDHYVPQPDRDAGSRTMLAFMNALLQAGRVVKFWTENGAYSEGYTEALQNIGIEVLYGPSTGGFAAWIAANGADIDGVLLSRPHIAGPFISPLRTHSKQARLAYYGHDLHGARMRRQAAGTGEAALAEAAEAMERMERGIWRQVDVVLYPSAEEAAAAQALEPHIEMHDVVPYAFPSFGETRDPPSGEAILFVAGFGHPPNEDAACWFVEEILPLVRAARPEAQFWIVGSNPTARVRGLAGDGVTIAANVSDAELADFYSRARVAAVPLRYGAGVKLKVVEALQQGLPLVTTPVGAQGCDGLEKVIAVADSAAPLAAAMITLLTDDRAWRTLSADQIAYAKQRFSETALRSSLLTASGL
jgi:GT2 family glycosyltransferase/glycosyltransferase involved in cell wall biosynthesis